MRPRFVGIAGGTGSGKSTLVRALADRLHGPILDLDSYYVDRVGVSAAERNLVNYDEPAAIDAGLLIEHLRHLADGDTVRKPRYSFESHTRVGHEVVTPAPFIFIEGLFALWWGEVRALLGLRVFVDAAANLRLARRIRRDVLERGRTVDQVLRQYAATVRPMHDLYVEPTRAHADLVVTNAGSVDECVAQVASALRACSPTPN